MNSSYNIQSPTHTVFPAGFEGLGPETKDHGAEVNHPDHARYLTTFAGLPKIWRLPEVADLRVQGGDIEIYKLPLQFLYKENTHCSCRRHFQVLA
jgi:hypothetical protein